MVRILAIVMVIIVVAACSHDDAPEVDTPSGEDTEVVGGLQLTYFHTGVAGNFNALFFTDTINGYLAGYKGDIYHTTDGGQRWERQAAPTDLPLYDIYFLNSREGFAVGGESDCTGGGCIPRGEVILRTKDGGTTWEKCVIAHPSKVALASICFATDSLGFAVGGNSILTTKDRGLNWKHTFISELKGTMLDVKFVDAHKGLISCSAGKVVRTVDGGQHWTISTPFDEKQHYRLSIVDENTVFIAGQSFIGKSENFGERWEGLPTNPGPIYSLKFMTDQLGYAFGMGQYSGGDFGHHYGAIYYTCDGGTNWTIKAKLTKMTTIDACSFPTNDVGYAVSGNVVMKVERK